MNIAISNIAWEPAEDEAVLSLMIRHGVTGVELAPTTIWDKPTSVPAAEIKSYASKWTDRGIQIVSLQALLFGQPELTLFESIEQRKRTIDYLGGIIHLASELGARILVLGAPKNRLKGTMPAELAHEIALEFFSTVGSIARERGCVLCIEPNPVAYGCDFVTTSAEARNLVAAVNNPGFGLHLDAAAMTLSQEDVAQQLTLSLAKLKHFHISEPELGQVGKGSVDHVLIAEQLGKLGYENWLSIEMRKRESGDNVGAIAEVLRFVQRTYHD